MNKKIVILICLLITPLFSFNTYAATKAFDFCLNCSDTQFVSKAKSMTPRPFAQANDEEVEEVEPSRHYVYLADPVNNTHRKYYIEVDNSKRVRTRTISTDEKNMFDSAINYYHVSKEIDEELKFSQQDIADYAQQKSIPKSEYQYKSGSANDGLCNDAYHYTVSLDCQGVINKIIEEKYNSRGLWGKYKDVSRSVDISFQLLSVSSVTIKGDDNKIAIIEFENGSKLVIDLIIKSGEIGYKLDKNLSQTSSNVTFAIFEQVVKDLNHSNLTAIDADLIIDHYSERGYSCTINTSTKANYRYKVMTKVDGAGINYIYIDVHTDVSDEHDVECRGN